MRATLRLHAISLTVNFDQFYDLIR